MKKVWIDPGHGGKDPGAVAHGLQEKDIVLAVSLAIKQQLEDEYEDVQVMLSRSQDIFLELKQRTDKANAAGADILVSIHCNAGGGAGGFESFRYTSASAASRTLQNVLHTEIMAALKPHGITDRGQKSKNLHMVRESNMPAVLTENLFIDVAADAARLKRSDVIAAMVSGHVTGIAKYLGLSQKGDEPMTREEKAAFDKLAKRVAELEAAAKRVPAPKWFVAEFGSADLGGVISEPMFTLGEWRVLAVGLRVRK